jgi:hypothetical protein
VAVLIHRPRVRPQVSAYVFAPNPRTAVVPHSSRERPRDVKNDGNGWSIEPAGQESDLGIVAGSEIGLENTLKVETRVRTPLGLRA